MGLTTLTDRQLCADAIVHLESIDYYPDAADPWTGGTSGNPFSTTSYTWRCDAQNNLWSLGLLGGTLQASVGWDPTA